MKARIGGGEGTTPVTTGLSRSSKVDVREKSIYIYIYIVIRESYSGKGEKEEGPLCDPGSELLLGGSARLVRGYTKLDEEKICTRYICILGFSRFSNSLGLEKM